ncbi:uncharacterized protein LOC119332465 [Triticum dicoccoides]|uniref:uncharacterized protein LOC119332465 n=1 Tax=Triticum dicoccoides TaxID=85692 RepID=UPI00188E0375|nr:uncharacterized protein LOC119332465 [Triticum dicoccoides]
MASFGRFIQNVTRGARLARSGVPITTGMRCGHRAYSLLSESQFHRAYSLLSESQFSAHRGRRFSKVISLPITIARHLHGSTNTKLETPVSYVSSKSSKIEINVKVDGGLLLEDPEGYINLWKLFDQYKVLCFEPTDSSNAKLCFTSFAVDILKELYMIVLKEGQGADFLFKFEASQILVKWDCGIVEHIAIPASQFQSGKSIYVDRIVGAFTSLVYSICGTVID